MKLFVTVLEETVERAIETIRGLPADHDGVEIRAERFPSLDLHALRASTGKPLILTRRSVPEQPAGPLSPAITRAALEAGIDFVDVEWREGVEIFAPERTVLSHHDYQSVRDVKRILTAMRTHGCAHTKVAATPQTFAGNNALLELLGSPGTTVIGMGERGLYSRILAPFRGSELAFVAATAVAAPGQLTLERALEIYGARREKLEAKRVFAIVGNPAGHSLSPSIHNALFREEGVSAAYTIASVERFEEITEPFLHGEPAGLSVTAPFKEEAFAFAVASGAEIGENASLARAVNTLVNVGSRILADNTDVDGFEALIPAARKAAVIGAGGTARAALVALGRASIRATVFNRTASKGDEPLEALAGFGADLIVNTLPADVEITIPACDTYVEAAYGGAMRQVSARTHIGGLELLRAQAVRQHELFLRVFSGGAS